MPGINYSKNDPRRYKNDRLSKDKKPKIELENWTQKVHNELRRNGGKNGRLFFAYSPLDSNLVLTIKNCHGEDVEIKHSAQLILEEGPSKVLNLIRSWGYPYDCRMELYIQKGVIQ